MNSVSGRPAASSRLNWLTMDNPWVRRVVYIGIALVVGLVLGQQLYRPQPRVIKALVGIGVLYSAWKFPIPVSLSAFIVLFPFPFPTAYGSSNTIFVFLIAAMWLAQIVLRTSAPPGRTLLDAPILVLLGACLMSFNSVRLAASAAKGLVNLSTVLAGVFVYYLIVSTVKNETTLRRMVRTVTIMAMLCFATAVWELVFPGTPIIRGWILSGLYYNPLAIERGLRVGGPFQDFELFAEFNATMLPLMIFQYFQSPRGRTRWFWLGLLLLNFVVLMSTVTRGATIAFILGMVYMLFMIRHSVKFKDYLLTILVAISVWSGVEFFLSNYTVSGSVVERLLNTTFVDGMPDSRTFWPDILKRALEKPWFGHGLSYDFGEHGREKLRKFFWPHNGYLYYLHTVGFFGLGAFLWILGRLYFSSLRHSRWAITGGNYPRTLLFVWNVVLVIFAIDEAKIEYLRNPHYQFWPWIFFGLMVATYNVVQAGPAAAASPSVPDATPAGAGGRRQFPWRRKIPGR